jgi:hypothetical protein
VATFALSAAMARTAFAQVVAAEPIAPITAPYPDAGDGREVQIVLQLIVDTTGRVESVVETSRAPSDAAEAFSTTALEAAKRATFKPSSRDGKPIRSRVEYVVVFRAPARGDRAPDIEPIEEPGAAASPSELPPAPVAVTVRAPRQPRGLGEFQIGRELLDASPHMVASEQLSLAPGFFVDHEDSEGLGNDVHLRGFDLEHGSGIEFRVGAIPVNSPVHVAGAGYADLNFIIPEVVRSIRVLEGPFDPRQGDAAIAGSASFDLGVVERGYRLRGTYGSFRQRRLAAVVAPPKEDEETFAAFAWRETDGFGPGNRASSSGSTIGGYAVDLPGNYRMKLSASAYAARTAIPGVLRRDDFDAGRLGFDDSYPSATGQSALATRAHVGVELERAGEEGARTAFSTWAAVTSLRLRQNFTGASQPLPSNPSMTGPGDLFESANDETAIGASALFHSRRYDPAPFAKVAVEPGVYVRAGSGDQTKTLLDPTSLATWDRKIDARVQKLDAGGYVDIDLRLFRRLRLSGGVRADGLLSRVDDRLSAAGPARRAAFGFVVSPRVSAELEVLNWLQTVISYGEGFRSLEPLHLPDGDRHPYSKVRSVEGGVRSKIDGERYRWSLAVFQSWVGNELVFDADGGGLETAGASVRRGLVAAVLGHPVEWLDGSMSLSLNRAEYEDPEPGASRLVPEVPSVLFRADVGLHSEVAKVGGRALEARVGVGPTYIAGRHLTDDVVMRPVFVLNGNVGVRYAWVSLDIDGYNLLARRYPDDEAIFESNWSAAGAPRPLSLARHFSAAAPLTVLATLTLHVGG